MAIMDEIYTLFSVLYKNLGKTSGFEFAIILGLGLVAGTLLSTLGSRVTRLTTMDVEAREQANFGYLSPIGKCWSCGNTLPLWQQIPLLSYVFLRRKCHYCSTEISLRYPLTETLTACLLLSCLLRWSELKVGVGYFVFFSGLLLAVSITLRGIILPIRVTFLLCLLGLLASALEFGKLTPKDAILGAILGYTIPYVYNKANASMNSHVERIHESYLLLFASIGSWLGSIIALEMLLFAIAINLIYRTIWKPHPLAFDYQIAIVAIASFVRIFLSRA
jgi:prepilin signal peptidase PulO-like enzyme (type II secretory pathway)